MFSRARPAILQVAEFLVLSTANLFAKMPQIYSPKYHKSVRQNATNLFGSIDFFVFFGYTTHKGV